MYCISSLGLQCFVLESIQFEGSKLCCGKDASETGSIEKK